MKLKITSKIGAAVVALALTSAANAVPIIGNMSFSGGGLALFDAGGNPTTVASAIPVATVQFLGAPIVSAFGTDGAYSVAIGDTVSFPAGTMNPWTFASEVGTLWATLPSGFSFYVNSAYSIDNGITLDIYGAGTVSKTGFDDTSGTWVLTTQGGNITTVTWSSTISSVPDGGTSVALLGVSLLGLAGVRRKLSKR